MTRPSKKKIIGCQKIVFYLLFTLKFPFITKDTPRSIHLLWECISWISVFVPVHVSVCHFKGLYEGLHTESIDVLSNIGLQGAWLTCSTITLLQFKLMSKHLSDMFDEIDAHFQWRSPKGKTFVTLDRCYKYANFSTIFWQMITGATVVINLFRPLFKDPVLLPSVSWYYLDLDNSFNFALAYILQGWAQLVVVWGFAAGSTLFCSLSFLVCGQFNILRCALKNLVFTSGIYKRFPDTLELTNIPADSVDYFFAKEMNDTLAPITENPKPSLRLKEIPALTAQEIQAFRRALTNSVEHHHHLQNICQLMETFFNFFAILRVFEITAQMCFMAFVYTKTADLWNFMYGLLAGIDLFFLTYPADHITYQSCAIGTSLMVGPWYVVSKHFRDEFIIIMMQTSRPIRFTAGKILSLNADRLRSAVTAAFSYYTLISGFDQEE